MRKDGRQQKHGACARHRLSYPCQTHRLGSSPHTGTSENDGPDGHKDRPRRTKQVVICSVVLVAYTKLCPTACGCGVWAGVAGTGTCLPSQHDALIRRGPALIRW